MNDNIFGGDSAGKLANKSGKMPPNRIGSVLARAASLRMKAPLHDFGNENGPDTNHGNREFSVHIHLPTAARAHRMSKGK